MRVCTSVLWTTAMIVLLAAQGVLPANGDEEWELVVNEDFSKPDAGKGWILEGQADVSVTADGELLIQTINRLTGKALKAGRKRGSSVFWYPEPVWGDLRFEFDGRAETDNRSIFFFNARARKGHKSIFEWERPEAKYADYAADDRIELYTLSILRYRATENLRGIDQKAANFLRDSYAQKDRAELMRLNGLFQKRSVIHQLERPAKDPDEMAHYVITVIGNRLTLEVDGKQMFDFVDELRADEPFRGGYFGIRNFRPTKAWYDNIKVFRRRETGTAPAASETDQPLPFAHQQPELYEQVDIVPMPKQIRLLGRTVPMAGARLLLGPAMARTEQAGIGAETINRAVVRLGGQALPVTEHKAARNNAERAAAWTVVIGTTAGNPLVARAVAEGRADVGENNPGERGYEIRVNEAARQIYLAGADALGALYACVTFAELLESKDDTVSWRATLVRDWPDAVQTWFPGGMNGPRHPLIWSLLLRLSRKYAWCKGEAPPIPPEERAAYLEAIKAETDRLLRWKVSGVFYPATFRNGHPYRPLELYDLLREGIEYGKARGIAAIRYAQAPIIGSIERYPELGERCTRARGLNYGWCHDALREKTAAELAKVIAHVGYTDVGFHDVDTGSYIDNPAGWENRCDECRKRWGDNYAAATVHKHMPYVDAIKAAAPDVELHLVFVPYFIDILDPEAGRSLLRRRFGASADVDELADEQRTHWADVWRKWDRAFPEHVTFVFRETTPEAVRAFTELVPGRGAVWALCYLSRAWTSPFSERPAMLGSYARNNPRDVIWLFGYADLLAPATMLATREYAWNLKTPGHRPWEGGGWGGGQPLLEHWKRGEAREEVFDVVLPHVARNLFGRDMAPHIVTALRQNVSPAQIFAYGKARMKIFNPLDSLEKMQWQAQRAGAAAAAIDKAWAVFRAEAEDGAHADVHRTAWLVQYREMFHAAARMAEIRMETKRARERARAQDEAGALAAIARGKQRLSEASAAMDRLDAERADLDNAILAYGERVRIRGVHHWICYLAKNAQFDFAREELEQTRKEIPGLVTMGGVPAAIVQRLARERVLRATAARQPVVLDGRLEEAAWREAFPIESFFVYQTRDLAQAYTRMRLIYDRENLYVGARAYASADTEISDEDVVEVFLKHPGIERDYVHLFVHPDGRLRQQYCARREGTEGMKTKGGKAWSRDNEWTFDGIASAVRRTNDHWTAELRVPLAAIGTQTVDSRLKVNLCRTAPLTATRESSSIQTPPAKRSFHDPSTFLAVHPAGEERHAGPEIVPVPRTVTRETHTMADGVGTVVRLRLEVEADTVLHNVQIRAESYDERGQLHERREWAKIERIFFRWASDDAFSIRLTKVAEAGGVRVILAADEGTGERWIRWGGWQGTPEAGSLFVPGKGGQALRGAAFFSPKGAAPDGKTSDLFNDEQGTIEFWVRPEWRGSRLEPLDRSAVRTHRHAFVDFSASQHIWYHRGPVIVEHVDGRGSLVFSTSKIYKNSGARASVDLTGQKDWRPGTWHHVACVWEERAEPEDRMRIYLDGCRASSNVQIDHPENWAENEPLMDSDAPFLVQVGCRNTGRFPANAAIDDLRISRVARYKADFRPPDGLTPDIETTVLFGFDGTLEGNGMTPDGQPCVVKAVAGIAALSRD